MGSPQPLCRLRWQDLSPNVYTDQWFDLFLRKVDPAQTAREVAFLSRQLPVSEFRTALDICCGEGRHSIPLATAGYDVTGIDANERALEFARRSAPEGARFQLCDLRNLDSLACEPFDAAMCMWQSFGYFDHQTNERILHAIARILRPGGRFVLDICNRDFFQRVPAIREFQRENLQIIESKSMTGNRQRVTLSYSPPRLADVFEWQLYLPEELQNMASEVGLNSILACSNFDERIPASDQFSRMQLVFERRNLDADAPRQSTHETSQSAGIHPLTKA